MRILLFIAILSSLIHKSFAQETMPSDSTKRSIVTMGVSLDYLKLQTLLIDNSTKWEGAINIAVLDKFHAIAELGNAILEPKEAYKNANYKSEGLYLRTGLDYSLSINPQNKFSVGLRYSRSVYEEQINFETSNPIYEPYNNQINRKNLGANWFEFVITSEKRLRSIFSLNTNDLVALGFKFRVKGKLTYEKFDYADTKVVPGYGLTNTKVNPEFNLYIKFRIPIVNK